MEAANNKDAWMCRLICVFIVRIWYERISYDMVHFMLFGQKYPGIVNKLGVGQVADNT